VIFKQFFEPVDDKVGKYIRHKHLDDIYNAVQHDHLLSHKQKVDSDKNILQLA